MGKKLSKQEILTQLSQQKITIQEASQMLDDLQNEENTAANRLKNKLEKIAEEVLNDKEFNLDLHVVVKIMNDMNWVYAHVQGPLTYDDVRGVIKRLIKDCLKNLLDKFKNNEDDKYSEIESAGFNVRAFVEFDNKISIVVRFIPDEGYGIIDLNDLIEEDYES